MCLIAILLADVMVFLAGPTSQGLVGVTYILTCKVTLSHRPRDSSVSIQWQGPSTDEQRYINLAQDTLFINELTLDPLTLADGGDYTCTAHYTAAGHTATISSDVEHVIPTSESSGYHAITFYGNFPVPSPSLLLRSDSIILVGEETVVYCDIDLIGVVRGSDVAVDVTWLKEGVPVSTDSRVTISGVTGDEDGVSSSLTFSPVHFSDMATYECHVTLTPLLGPASPVSSSQSLHLDIGVCVCVCVYIQNTQTQLIATAPVIITRF